MAGYDLGTARGIIEIDYRGDGAKRAADDFENVGKKARSASDVMGSASSGMVKMGAALAVGLGLAAKSAADFEHRMSAVKAVSGASADEMAQLTKKALDLGAETVFSAGEAAVAIEELVKAGLSVSEVMDGAADATVALAAAGEIELPRAAEIAANAMNQFKLSAKDLPAVADTIAGAANASAISVDELGESLNYVGPVAATLGVSLEEASAALAILGNNGIKGSSAGTALRSMLSRLTPTTKIAAKEFKKLGLITKDGTNLFYDAEGSLKPLSEVMQILNDKTKGLTDQQKIAFTKKAFGLETMAAANILMGETSESFDKMSGSIGKISAADVAAERLNNLKGSLEQMKGSLETAAIQLGTILIPYLRTFVDQLTKVVNGFSGLDPEMQKLVVTVTAIASALLLFGGIAIKIVLGLMKLAAGAKVVGAALVGLKTIGPIFAALGAAITGPLGIAIAIIAALAAAFFIAYKKITPFREAVNAVAQVLKGVFLSAMSKVPGILSALWVILQRVGNFLASTFGPALQTAGTALRTAFGDAFTRIRDAVVTHLLPALQQLAPAFRALAPVLVSIGGFLLKLTAVLAGALFMALFQVAKVLIGVVLPSLIQITAFLVGGLITAISAVITFIIRLAAAFINFGVGAVQAVIIAFTAIRAAIMAAWAGIVAFVTGAITAVGAAISAGLAFIAARWNAFWQGPFGQLLIAVWNLIVAIVRFGISAVRAAIVATLNSIRTFWTGIWNGIKAITTTVWTAIRGAVTSALSSLRSAVSSGVAAVRSAISSAWNAVKSATSAAWNAVKTAVLNAVNSALARVGTSTSDIRNKVTAAWNAVKSSTREAWNAFVSLIKESINKAMDKVRSIKSTVTGALSGAASWLYNAGRNIIQGLIDGITSKIRAVTDKLRELTNLIPDSKGPPKRDKILLEENGVLIMTGLMTGVDSMIAPFLKQLSGIANLASDAAIPSVGIRSTASAAPIVNVPDYGAKVHQEVTVMYPLPERQSTAIDESLQLAGAFV